MDEWISSADNEFKKKMDSKLEEMIEETPIVIIASHSKDRLYNWASKVINLKSGKITKVENTENFKDQPAFKPNAKLIQRYNALINIKKKDQAFKMIPEIWPEKKSTHSIITKNTLHIICKQKILKMG